MRTSAHVGAGTRLGEAAAENPGRAALLSLITTPLAMRAGRVALTWARRNPGLALAVAAGAVAWWGAQSLRRNSSNGRGFEGSTDEPPASSL